MDKINNSINFIVPQIYFELMVVCNIQLFMDPKGQWIRKHFTQHKLLCKCNVIIPET